MGAEELEGQDIDQLSDEALAMSMASERALIDRLEADFARRLARFQARRGFERFGAADVVAWLKQYGRMSGAAAMERVKVAQGLETLPLMAQALGDGEISFGHAAVIARAAEEAGPESAPKLEELAVVAARTMHPGELRLYTERVRNDLDSRAFLEDYNRAFARRRLDLGQSPNGMWVLEGRLDREGGACLATVLEALQGPKANDDTRTPAQRRADAMTALARMQLDGGSALPRSGGQRPHLTVTATVETLLGNADAPAGELMNRFPVPKETVQRIACDCSLTPLVVDDNGDPLDFGRTIRTISPALRRALVARDKHCRFPDCDRPVSWCDGHHLFWWSVGGRTGKRFVALVCRLHHTLLHEGGWSLEGDPAGELVAVPP